MQKNLWSQIAEYVKNNRFRSAWKKVVRVLACVVVFCTTYALILPAITMEQKSYCGQEEHTHTKECYQEIRVPSELICPLVEGEVLGEPAMSVSDGDAGETPAPHVHTEDCYGVPEVAPLTCQLEENEQHQHDFLCYGSWELTCTKEVHTHSLACFSDPQADVESASVWENMVWNMDLSGIWTEDVVAIAKSQLGYKESATNYQVNEDTSVNGYTRYGAWAQEPYGDWEAAFAAFCVYYAEVEGMPLEADTALWQQELQKAELYHTVEEGHEPKSGDLLFMDTDKDGNADLVAVVCETVAATEETGTGIKVIQGNVTNQVQYVTYDALDEAIMGYGVMPTQPEPIRSFVYADETVWVKVKLPVDTTVPKDAQLKVTAVAPESAQYEELLNQAQEAVDKNVVKAQFYDISFFAADYEYIPVSEKARVMMRFAEDVVDPRDKTVVLHYENETEVPVVLEDVSVVEEDPATTMTDLPGQETIEYTNTLVSYETEGFSVFGLVEIETGTDSEDAGENGSESEVTDTYVTQVPSSADAEKLYTTVSDAGSKGKVYMIHGNLSYSQNYNLTSVVDGEYLNAVAISSREDTSESGFSVTSNVNSNQLWKFIAVEGMEDTYYVQPVDQPEMYLSLIDYTDGENGETKKIISLSTTKKPVKIVYAPTENEKVFYLSDDAEIKVQQGESEVTVEKSYYLGFTYNNENQNDHKFFTTEYKNPNVGIYLSEYTDSENSGQEPETPSETTEEAVTNLGGKILMIVAINNDLPSAGITSIQSGAGLQTSTLTNVEFNNGNLIVEDVNNNMAFEFEEAETSGYYYIKAANFYGEPSNSVAGKYINISSSGVSFSDIPQAIEVVKGTTSGQEDVICMRIKEGETNYYLNLQDSIVTSTADNNALTNTANHFAVAELTEVEDVIEMIDSLPSKVEFDTKYSYDNGSANNEIDFSNKMAYRKSVQDTAIAAKEALDNLTDQQLNFVGKERVEKLQNELEFLWRKEPDIVTPANLNAKVKLFNYGANINNPTNSQYIFYNWEVADKVIDGVVQSDNRTAPTMSNILGPDGYPLVTNIGTEYNLSLSYLFNEKNVDANSYVMTHAAVMENGGGLFQLDDDGYYYYYADTNAAWYNPTENQFELYDVAVKPEYVLYRTDTNADQGQYDRVSNFLPYNEVLGNIIYDDKFSNGQVVSSVDKETKVDTAFLNTPIDLWFGMSIEYDFFIPKNHTVDGEPMIFEFHGDDDVFVYIDDVLVLNMGGIHEARSGSINFTTGDVVYDTDSGTQNKKLANLIREAGVDVKTEDDTLADYTMHNLKFFYLERGGTYSYAGIKFNMPALPENTLSVGKDIGVDGSYIDAKLDYTFRLANVNGNGEVTDDSFIITGKTFDIYDMATQVDTGRDGVVNADGTFTLKAGELAVFPDLISVVEHGKKNFVVQEILPDSVKGQYDDITYEVNGGEPISLAVEASSEDGTHGYINNKPEEGRTTYQTDVYSTDSGDGNFAHRFEFTNNVDENKLDTLNIKKLAAEGSNIDPNKEFRIKVNVGNDAGSLIQLPKDTPYTWTNGQTTENKTVGENGIITLKVGETATIKGFLAGTYWEIDEILNNEEKYIPTYAGTSQNGSSTIINGNAGTFGVGNTGDTVDFTVTNQLCDVLLQVPLSKTAIGNTDSATFHFDVERGTWENGNWTTLETKSDTSITISDATKTNFTLPLSILSTYGTPVYYKISERNSGGDFIYDDNYYIVEVTVTASGNGNEAAITNIWKNGTEAVDNASSLDFVNYKTNDVTISKKVINSTNPGDQGGEFPFEARIQLNDVLFTEITSDTQYTVENGVIRFNLKDTESVSIPVPVGGTLIVTETNNAGYQTSYQVTKDGVEETVTNGTSVTVSNIVGPARIDFTNQTGYELPATGGHGTHGYRWCGLLMILAAAGLLFYQARAKRKS